MVAASKSDEAKLEEIHRQVTQLRKSVESSSLSFDSQSQLKLLFGIEEDVFRSIAEERILECISFEGIDRREHMVVETHSNTYAWIVEDDETMTTSSGTSSDTSSETSSIEYQTEHEQDASTEQISQQSLADEEKIRAREKLSSWLAARDTSDIFHLSGRLGSGKSTLMKYIAESRRTAERLHQWAGEF